MLSSETLAHCKRTQQVRLNIEMYKIRHTCKRTQQEVKRKEFSSRQVRLYATSENCTAEDYISKSHVRNHVRKIKGIPNRARASQWA